MKESDNLTLMCFDFGLRRIGVATSHSKTGCATPLTTLACKNGRPDWPFVSELLQEWRPDLIIVGLPDDREANLSLLRSIKHFIDELKTRYAIEITTHDESLSSNEAYHRLKNMRKYQHRRIQKEHIDQLAAALILESWIQYNS